MRSRMCVDVIAAHASAAQASACTRERVLYSVHTRATTLYATARYGSSIYYACTRHGLPSAYILPVRARSSYQNGCVNFIVLQHVYMCMYMYILYIATACTVGAKAHTEYNHEFVDRQNLITIQCTYWVLACVFTCASVSRGHSLVRSSSLVEAPRLCL